MERARFITKDIALGKGPDTAAPKGSKAKKADKKDGKSPADATYLEVSSHRVGFWSIVNIHLSS